MFRWRYTGRRRRPEGCTVGMGSAAMATSIICGTVHGILSPKRPIQVGGRSQYGTGTCRYNLLDSQLLRPVQRHRYTHRSATGVTVTWAPMLQLALILVVSTRLQTALGEPMVIVLDVAGQYGVSVAVITT